LIEETTDFKEKEQIINPILSTVSESETTDSNVDSTDNFDLDSTEEKNSPESELSSESNTIPIEEANTTNCLALTIQKDHKLVAVKNVFFHSIKMTWKIIASAVVLTIIKLFS
jgi:hypothetical protein